MRIIKTGFLSVLVLTAFVVVSAEEKTFEGELVDITCYSKGAMGESHRMCAARCAKSGKPVGIATKDGKVYTLLTESPGMVEYMAKTVKITGKLHEASQSIMATSILVKKGDEWVNIEIPRSM